jgi:hypothetical protein
MPSIPAPTWSDEQLEADRQAAIEVFRRVRMTEPLEQYVEAFDEYRGAIEDLLEMTVDLTQLRELALNVVTDKALLDALRYLAGPFLSVDDLKVLANVKSLAARTRTERPPDWAETVVETVLLGLDHRRFPWVVEDREPEEAERLAATLASAALMATQRIQTARRTESKVEQEAAVRERLLAADFEEVPAGEIPTLHQAPAAGHFCGESMFGTRKADFVVGLWDGRKMPLECKVSNSETNSIKRLNNDAAVKSVGWLQEFGTVNVVPAAVLAGVFKRVHLTYAQTRGLTLWWAHDLDALADWIEQTRPT